MDSAQSILGDLPVKSDDPDLDPDPIAIEDRTDTSGHGTHYATLNLRRANTVAQGGNTRNMTARDRSATSFLRAKSHEMLQQTPLKRSRTHQSPGGLVAGAREPKHFTVGNVGQNGKIFLRYLNPCAILPYQDLQTSINC